MAKNRVIKRRRRRQHNRMERVVDGRLSHYRAQLATDTVIDGAAVGEYVATLMTLAYVEGRQAEIREMRQSVRRTK